MPEKTNNGVPAFPTVSFAGTAGKPIKCKGWVCPKGAASWSPKNVVFDENLVVPAPGPRQVRVRMYAAGVNPVDAQRTVLLGKAETKRGGSKRSGRHPPPNFEFPYVCGIEGAGVVESVGEELGSESGLDFNAGDRVMFLADFTKGAGGTFAQYCVVDADVVTKIGGPNNITEDRMIDFVEAATFPAAAQTAYVALFDKLRVEKDRSIFISGASGGVGSIAVQLAHHFGLFVIASCSTPNTSYVKALGADVVIDYTEANVVGEVLQVTEGYGVDYVLEAASATLAEEHAEALRFGGGICVLTGMLIPSSDLVFRQQLSVHYVFIGMFHGSALARPLLRTMAENVQALYLQGAFDVHAEEVPLERAQAALEVIAQGHTRGKIVLTCFHPGEAATEEQHRRRLKIARERRLAAQRGK